MEWNPHYNNTQCVAFAFELLKENTYYIQHVPFTDIVRCQIR